MQQLGMECILINKYGNKREFNDKKHTFQN